MKKNMMKYAVAAMAAMMISGALTACGGSDKKAETTVAVETTAEETTAEETTASPLRLPRTLTLTLRLLPRKRPRLRLLTLR